MNKIALVIAMALSISACDFSTENTVAIDSYWKNKETSISDDKLARINSTFSEVGVKRVLNSSAEMIYEVHLKNGEIKYLSYDLSIIINGEMLRVSDGVNETKLSKRVLDAEAIVEDVLNPQSTISPKESALIANGMVSNTLNKDLSSGSSKKDNDEFTSFANDMIEQNNKAVSNDRISSDEDLEALKKRIYSNINERRKQIQPLTSVDSIKKSDSSLGVQHRSQEEAPENKFRTKSNVDTNHVKTSEKHIKYKNTLISKIGFDNKGNKLSEADKRKQMSGFIDKIRAKGDDWSIVYPSTSDENKGEIVVFTDPTCAHCKKFHLRINEITDLGYSIRYLFYPRFLALGLDDPKAQKNLEIIKSIWCADDRKKESDSIYNKNTMTGFTCDGKPEQEKLFPATDHYLLGLIAGVESTPTVILPNGKKVAGFNSTIAELK